MSISAMEQALEALEKATPVRAKDPQMQADAIVALRTAIEAAEKQGPVAYVVTTEVHGQMCSFIHRIDLTKLLPDGAKLYTTPPAAQRQWVRLTDEEIVELSKSHGTGIINDGHFARAIEARLWEKNT